MPEASETAEDGTHDLDDNLLLLRAQQTSALPLAAKMNLELAIFLTPAKTTTLRLQVALTLVVARKPSLLTATRPLGAADRTSFSESEDRG